MVHNIRRYGFHRNITYSQRMTILANIKANFTEKLPFQSHIINFFKCCGTHAIPLICFKMCVR